MNQLSALVIEDDPVIGTVFGMFLKQAGFDVEVDATGGNFNDRLGGRAPDLILLDIHLPFASGLDILEQIDASSTWKHAVTILATADIFHSKSLGAKADHVLIKPVSISKLIRIISDHWPDRIPPDLDFDPNP